MSETSTGRRKGARVRRPPPAFNSSQPPAPKSVTAAAAKGKAKVKKKLAAAKVPVPSETDPSAFMKAPQEADGACVVRTRGCIFRRLMMVYREYFDACGRIKHITASGDIFSPSFENEQYSGDQIEMLLDAALLSLEMFVYRLLCPGLVDRRATLLRVMRKKDAGRSRLGSSCHSLLFSLHVLIHAPGCGGNLCCFGSPLLQGRGGRRDERFTMKCLQRIIHTKIISYRLFQTKSNGQRTFARHDKSDRNIQP